MELVYTILWITGFLLVWWLVSTTVGENETIQRFMRVWFPVVAVSFATVAAIPFSLLFLVF